MDVEQFRRKVNFFRSVNAVDASILLSRGIRLALDTRHTEHLHPPAVQTTGLERSVADLMYKMSMCVLSLLKNNRCEFRVIMVISLRFIFEFY